MFVSTQITKNEKALDFLQPLMESTPAKLSAPICFSDPGLPGSIATNIRLRAFLVAFIHSRKSDY
jgi:hypothetical protein